MISQPLTLPKTAPVKDAAIAAIRQLQGELGLLGVTGVWLFGSVARGDDTAESDIDVAIRTVRRGDWMIKSHTRELLEPVLGRSVDVLQVPLKRSVVDTITPDLVKVY